MKIITIEEHINYKKLSEALREPLSKAAPYLVKASPEGLAYHVQPEAQDGISEKRISDMEAGGIAMQVLSYAASPQLLPPSQAIPLTMDANDHLAEEIHKYPDRFSGFATLPWSDPEAAANELERAVKKLNLKGALLSGRPSPGSIFLDALQYRPVLEKASELNVPIYIHPGFPVDSVREAYYSGLTEIVSDRLSLFGWGWHAEAGIQIMRMILSGVFDRIPNLQLIAGHWGEMIPFFLSRLDEALPPKATSLQYEISEYFKNHVYVTPSGMFDMPHFKFIMEVMGADRIIYSVDSPYISSTKAASFLDSTPASDIDKEKISHLNAEKLLNLK